MTKASQSIRRLVVAILYVAFTFVAYAGNYSDDGYRIDNIYDPVPEVLDGGTIVDGDEAKAIWDAGGVFIDVLPNHNKPADWPADQLWLPVAHTAIMNAYWFANGGRARLEDATLNAMLKRWSTLQRDTGAIVFYCRTSCWLSWNAARRAINAGISSVYWFPGGIDEWNFLGYPTQVLNQPEDSED